jgi:hypothetical protein
MSYYRQRCSSNALVFRYPASVKNCNVELAGGIFPTGSSKILRTPLRSATR